MSESTKVPTINHTYAKEGNYIIELTIVDNQGATATQSLSVQPNLPFVDFNYILNGLKVSFDGSFSHSVNGEQISSFTWDFGDSHNGTG